jgi:DNA repair exonuclease SbcCD nuclease subunit
MKLALITDTHYGIRNDNVVFLDANKKFLDNIFFPYLHQNNIDHIIHLGDVVDRRKHINFLTANRLRSDFFDQLHDKGINGTFIVGNHDTYYKNINSVNALTELLDGKYPNIALHIDPVELIIDNCKILLLPWICADNRENSMQLIQNSNARICMGHLEIEGFEMYKGSVSLHGEKKTTFDKFELTLSGHYHHRSTDGSIVYLGAHSEFTWSDYNDPRGFHILDTNTLDLTFVENPYKMFKKIWYDDTDKTIESVMNFDASIFENTYMKVIVKNKTNPYWFDMFCEKLEKENPIDISIVEDHHNMDIEDDSNIVNEAESTLDIFRSHIKQMDTSNINTAKLDSVITNLYNKALTMGVE